MIITSRGARKPFTSLLVLFLAYFSLVPARAENPPLIRAHAHNDYEHARPLLDALEHGFCSVEADIHLVDGELLVAHSLSEANPGRTLENLYLNPLQERIRQNAGRVFRDGPEFTLLIDLKTDWKTTYPVLRSVLTNYAAFLTTFTGAGTRSNAVRVIISGNRSLQMFEGEELRLAAYDGTLDDLGTSLAPSLVPWISASWGSTFKWRGSGTIPGEELDRLKSIVARAHAQGRRVRFWGTPDKARFWEVLWDAGVDLINTDDLPGLQQFISSKSTVPPI